MKYSIYTSCFNIIKNDFDYWQETIPKWLSFIEYGKFGEIILAVNNSEDNTLHTLSNFIKDKRVYKNKETTLKDRKTVLQIRIMIFKRNIKNNTIISKSNNNLTVENIR